MLEALQFVKGAVSTKDFVPAMKHFVIEEGTVRSYNGVMALSAPVPTTLTCVPKAVPLIKAIEGCGAEVELSMTPAQRLRVKSGGLTVFVDCVPGGDVPHMKPAGDYIRVDGAAWLKAFRVLSPFIGDDASRPFTNGILLTNKSAYATNNVIVIEYWLGDDVPFVVNIPQMAIKEILRIDEPVEYLQLDERSITFHYDKGKWLRTQLLVGDWPDLSRILDRPSTPVLIDERIFDGLQALAPFAEDAGRIFFENGVMRTHLGDGVGASYELPGSTLKGCYRSELLSLLRPVTERADFTDYPAPCMFFGERIRGAMSAMALPGVYRTEQAA
jgi:DNA polymerase III sliding clamp (beta) subunit (PCNA family)